MTPDSIIARYEIETQFPLDRAAASMTGEQSAGTFVRVEGESAELLSRHGARVVSILETATLSAPSLPGARSRPGGVIRQAEVVIAYPLENIGPSLVNLMTLVAGNLFELGMFSGLRLVGIELPPAFTDAFPGPAFGIAGTRRLTGIDRAPVIGTIIKPSVGLTPGQTAALVDRLLEAGLDFIKDDELIANPPYSPLADRVAAVMEVVNRHADRTGRKAMIAFNITDESDAMLRHHDSVVAAGGTCVMVSLIPVGLGGFERLRRHAAVPIHGHRNGWGMLSRHPALGMDFRAFQKLWRLAGVDHLHVNGIGNKFCESDESVIRSARECQQPINGRFTVMPVFSSGQTVLQVAATYTALDNTDLIHLAGGGILGHPDGAAAGVAAYRQAWDAALAKIDLQTHAATHRPLARAIEAFSE